MIAMPVPTAAASRTLAAAMLAVLAAAVPATAQMPESEAPAACAKPLWPMCATDTMSYEDQVARQRCTQDLRRYISDAVRYRDCLAAQVEAARTRVEEARALEACLGAPDAGTCDDVRPE